ncbi:4'-phosphopantetheinyl transferase family protein [Cyclobacterium plantarum]|uniref:4-phosphopantetheinyl transferase n=1 Tax=Cyclobacterium plantarum TaxID=2716263 RepID=A0ABX0HC78_9BACT|nr:4'-phosphopantetheinyl transferase superfamily protein [Cyclobacterium plantarum]NHE57772.1 4-phosphopantetheinyl transferase [Cyclobacterium plantarum]
MQTKIEKISPLSAFAINNIHESENSPMDFLSFREKLSLANIGHPQKRKEWKGARLAIKSALDHIQLPYPGFYKDAHGKSHTMDGYGYVSLTHHGDYSGAIFHKEMPVGIDLEKVRDKTVTLAPKYLDTKEMDFLNKDPYMHTMAWSVKETIFKCQGRKGISLRQNILLQPFSCTDEVIKGKIHGTDFADHHYAVKVITENDMILTYTIW